MSKALGTGMELDYRVPKEWSNRKEERMIKTKEDEIFLINMEKELENEPAYALINAARMWLKALKTTGKEIEKDIYAFDPKTEKYIKSDSVGVTTDTPYRLVFGLHTMPIKEGAIGMSTSGDDYVVEGENQ